MVNRTLSIWNELRPFSVGFDELFDHFNNTLEYTVKQQTSYPPYNINKIDDLNFQVEMALAGFSKKDIEVKYADNQLTIKSVESDKKDEKESLHRCISKRSFKRYIWWSINFWNSFFKFRFVLVLLKAKHRNKRRFNHR